MIAIINYGGGNVGSVINAIDKLGYESVVTNNAERIFAANAVILPGVGAAGDTVKSLEKAGMVKVIRQLVEEKRPLFAVCVGLQVLLSSTEEGGGSRCLDIIKGNVKRLPPGLKIPHMGWNQVKQRIEHGIFNGIPDDSNFYFVHSYYAEPSDDSIIAGTTEYGLSFCSMIIKDNLLATQFHPEKSGELGLRMYSNFIKMAVSRG
jgi:imidazole glycerol-phosphate synthase subunit HisH